MTLEIIFEIGIDVKGFSKIAPPYPNYAIITSITRCEQPF